jgi:2-C-methyl-D-erythritol 4-phosphate cytidylyltransferase
LNSLYLKPIKRAPIAVKEKSVKANKMDVIIVAGGASRRFKSSIPKQFIDLLGKPVFLYSVEQFSLLPFVNKVIVVIPPKMSSQIPSKFTINKKICWAYGGKKRFDSVRNGLSLVDKASNFVAVHDAARPLVSTKDIKAIFQKAVQKKAAIAVEKTKDTIKAVKNGSIAETIDRKPLWNAQTPQIFATNILIKAYSNPIAPNITDDSELVEKLGTKVFIVETSSPNFKITSQQDLELAKTCLKFLQHGRK